MIHPDWQRRKNMGIHRKILLQAEKFLNCCGGPKVHDANINSRCCSLWCFRLLAARFSSSAKDPHSLQMTQGKSGNMVLSWVRKQYFTWPGAQRGTATVRMRSFHRHPLQVRWQIFLAFYSELASSPSLSFVLLSLNVLPSYSLLLGSSTQRIHLFFSMLIFFFSSYFSTSMLLGIFCLLPNAFSIALTCSTTKCATKCTSANISKLPAGPQRQREGNLPEVRSAIHLSSCWHPHPAHSMQEIHVNLKNC